MTSQVAYNLVTQFRRQAAALAELPPRRLSFKRTWTTPNATNSRTAKAATTTARSIRNAPKSTHFKTRKPPRDPPQAKVK